MNKNSMQIMQETIYAQSRNNNQRHMESWKAEGM